MSKLSSMFKMSSMPKLSQAKFPYIIAFFILLSFTMGYYGMACKEMKCDEKVTADLSISSISFFIIATILTFIFIFMAKQ